MTQPYGHSGKGLQSSNWKNKWSELQRQIDCRGLEIKKGEVVYRVRSEAKGFAATMQRDVRGKPLDIRQIMHNDRVSLQRMPCEMVYMMKKGVFKVGKMMVATLKRVNLKMILTAFCFNLHQMRILIKKRGVGLRAETIKNKHKFQINCLGNRLVE